MILYFSHNKFVYITSIPLLSLFPKPLGRWALHQCLHIFELELLFLGICRLGHGWIRSLLVFRTWIRRFLREGLIFLVHIHVIFELTKVGYFHSPREEVVLPQVHGRLWMRLDRGWWSGVTKGWNISFWRVIINIYFMIL